MAEPSILRDALVYLGAAVICVPLAKRSGLGSVLGYLVAGFLIGPSALRWVGDVQSTLHFAEFGVVLMLFLIGLELDLKRLIEMRRAVFGGGLTPGATGFPDWQSPQTRQLEDWRGSRHGPRPFYSPGRGHSRLGMDQTSTRGSRCWI